MKIIPHRFLFRLAYQCRFVADLPRRDSDELLDLPDECRIENFAAIDGLRNFADVRLAWNEAGLGLHVTVRGKGQPPQGVVERPRSSDGVSLWIDTRGDRTFHRASRFCHQFHFLAAGGGADRDAPVFLQSKIHRALQDAPFVDPDAVPLQVRPAKGGYHLESFLPAAALHGYDPVDHPRLGFYYAVHDSELNEQTLGPGAEFPFAEDPSLWATLDLVHVQKPKRSGK